MTGRHAHLSDSLDIGPVRVRNRLYRAPVLEGAGSGPDAADTYAKAFVENARAGVGLIIQGNSCFAEEGRTSPGMTLVNTRERVMALAPMVKAVHREGAAIFLQIGHGGIYAMEAWHEPHASARREPLLAASGLPLALRPAFRGVPIKVLSTDDIRAMAVTYGDVASWAREAGYDGIQLASANAKLLDQLLSPFYNRRTDEFGGSVEARASVLRLIRESVAKRAGADYPCTVKVPVEWAPPFMRRVTVREALRTAELAQEFGFDAVTPVHVSVFPDTTLSRGGVPRSIRNNPSMRRRMLEASPARRRRLVLEAGIILGARRTPFVPVWNRDLFSAASERLSIPVFAVGGIRTADEAASIVGRGEADMVGLGRPFYAEPDLAARFLDPSATLRRARCESSNLCVPAQMLGMKGVCYNPEVVRAVRRGE